MRDVLAAMAAAASCLIDYKLSTSSSSSHKEKGQQQQKRKEESTCSNKNRGNKGKKIDESRAKVVEKSTKVQVKNVSRCFICNGSH